MINNKFRFLMGISFMLFPLFLLAQEEKVDYIPNVSGYVQGYFQLDEGENEHSSSFKMKRVRLSVDGNICRKVTYKVQGDLLTSPMLMDTYVKYSVCPQFAVQAGQFKLPFTMETAMNPVDLEISDYGESVKGLAGYNSDVCGIGKSGRDIGIMFSGDFFHLDDKDFSLLNYSIGIFNGGGTHLTANAMAKDIVGRVKFHPWLKNLTLTGSGYFGKYHGVMRYSFGAEYSDNDLVIRSEYIEGKTESSHCFVSRGYYAVGGYRFRFGKEGRQQSLMPVLRYERFTGNIESEFSSKSYFTFGIDYWPIKNVNLKVDYSLIQNKVEDSSQHIVSLNRVIAMLSFRF